jgi:hypothetical protein
MDCLDFLMTMVSLHAVSKAIQTLGTVSSGELYARLSHRLDHATFERIIDSLKGAELVETTTFDLIWTGPEVRS